MDKKNLEKLLDDKTILAKSDVEDGMVVADLGCGGTGHFVFPLSKLVGKNGKVYAVDILQPALENIRRRASQDNRPNVIPVWSDLEIFKGTKIESGSLDVALLVNVFYQSKHRGAILREATRLLKKGGTMMIVDWEDVSLPLGPNNPEKVHMKDLILAGTKLGLNFEEDFSAGNYHYGLIFTKL